MNSTQFTSWQNGLTPYGELFIERLEDIQFTFLPEDVWQTYSFVLLNPEPVSVSINIEISQDFLVKTLNFDKAFIWIKIVTLSAIPLFLFQILLKATPDDLRDKIIFRILPAKYREYSHAEKKHFPILFIALVIVSILCFTLSVTFSQRADNAFIIINEIWKDYYYRFAIESLFLCILLITLFAFAMILWNFFYYPLTVQNYPNLELYKLHIKTELNFIKKLVIEPYHIIFLICFSAIPFLILRFTNNFLLYMSSFSLFIIYVTYIVSLASLKTQKELYDLFKDFEYTQALLSTGVIFSIIVVFAIRIILPIQVIISKYILDRSILLSHISNPGLLTSHSVVEYFVDYVIPVSAFSIPLAMLIVYYSFVFFENFYLPRKKEFKNIKVQKNILRDTLFGLVFFFAVFGLSLWLQSLLKPLDFRGILISLGSSFIASSFRNYLEAMKTLTKPE